MSADEQPLQLIAPFKRATQGVSAGHDSRGVTLEKVEESFFFRHKHVEPTKHY